MRGSEPVKERNKEEEEEEEEEEDFNKVPLSTLDLKQYYG